MDEAMRTKDGAVCSWCSGWNMFARGFGVCAPADAVRCAGAQGENRPWTRGGVNERKRSGRLIDETDQAECEVAEDEEALNKESKQGEMR